MQVEFERRKDERSRPNIDVSWSGHTDRSSGTLNDISSSGCFILTGGRYEDGEIVRLYLPMSDGRRVEFLGEIVNHVNEMGFAVRFIDLSEAQKEFLLNFVEMFKEDV